MVVALELDRHRDRHRAFSACLRRRVRGPGRTMLVGFPGPSNAEELVPKALDTLTMPGLRRSRRSGSITRVDWRGHRTRLGLPHRGARTSSSEDVAREGRPSRSGERLDRGRRLVCEMAALLTSTPSRRGRALVRMRLSEGRMPIDAVRHVEAVEGASVAVDGLRRLSPCAKSRAPTRMVSPRRQLLRDLKADPLIGPGDQGDALMRAWLFLSADDGDRATAADHASRARAYPGRWEYLASAS